MNLMTAPEAKELLSVVLKDTCVEPYAEKLAILPPPSKEVLPDDLDSVGVARGLIFLLQDALNISDELCIQMKPVSWQSLGATSSIARDRLLSSLAYYLLWSFDNAIEAGGPDDSVPHILADIANIDFKRIGKAEEFFPFFQYLDLCLALVAGSYWVKLLGDSEILLTSSLQASILPIASRNTAGMLFWIGGPTPVYEHAAFHMRILSATRFSEALDSIKGNPLNFIASPNLPNTNYLARLAAGDPELSELLGARLPLEMEKQITLLLRALGFLVSSTRPGMRRVDVIGASWSGIKYAFMLDAKSSRRPYYFPTSDQRAIKEYVDSYSRATHTQPDLRFVLIASSSPASTLSQKIRHFSSEIGIPLRFISAENLGNISNGIGGAISSTLLLTQILNGPEILDEEWTKNLIQRSKEQEEPFHAAIEAIYNQSIRS
ncbi:MAG: hypothetical protein MUO58_03980 [Anaerolineales bacterium]|nr:hypothetical protein [Anaerolineales bacterium]